MLLAGQSVTVAGQAVIVDVRVVKTVEVVSWTAVDDGLVVSGTETTVEGVWTGEELCVRTTGTELDGRMGLRDIVDVGRGGGNVTTLRDDDVVGIGMVTLEDLMGLREIVDVGRGGGRVTILRDDDAMGGIGVSTLELEAAPTLG